MFDETIVEVKPQTKPNRKKTINVEVDIDTKGRKYRMYCFVERHLSPIDKGIQAAHSIVEYSNLYSENTDYQYNIEEQQMEEGDCLTDEEEQISFLRDLIKSKHIAR